MANLLEIEQRVIFICSDDVRSLINNWFQLDEHLFQRGLFLFVTDLSTLNVNF